MTVKTIKNFLNSDDPLSEEAIELLLGHKEEDLFVEYKKNFDSIEEQQWLGITKDVMAFANTYGGYIVFGVKDVSFELIGLSDEVTNILSDTNQVLQKINRFIEPQFTHVRTKRHVSHGKSSVVMFIPESVGKTHIVVKEASFSQRSGKSKTVLRPGMIFIRRSASNHIIDSEGLNLIISRRIEHDRDSLFDKISRVIKAPPEQEILIVSPGGDSQDGINFTVSDAPDAIPIKGRSITVPPQTDEEEIAGWIAMSKRDPGFLPGEQRLWALLSKRHEIDIASFQVKKLSLFFLLSGVPTFFWFRSLDAEAIKEVLLAAIKRNVSIQIKAIIIETGAFLGRGFHTTLINKFGRSVKNLSPRSRQFPKNSPREFFSPALIESHRKDDFKESEDKFVKFLENKLTELSKEDVVGAMERNEAIAIDCYLYAKDDMYRKEK